jgi:tRNA (guanine37-N1)-methyltransferase
MHISILSLFPNMFNAAMSESMIKKAIDRQILNIEIYNIRNYAKDPHKMVDDTPYGGGAGMIMKPEPIFECVDDIFAKIKIDNTLVTTSEIPIILLSPQGTPFNQSKANELSKKSHLVLICGHYGGIDSRVEEHLTTECISIGDYILTGGELPAMILVDAITRLIPGVLGDERSTDNETFSNNLLESPSYTRPYEYRGFSVPDILRSGDHKKIQNWKKEESVKRTMEKRPDLITKAQLNSGELSLLKGLDNKTF